MTVFFPKCLLISASVACVLVSPAGATETYNLSIDHFPSAICVGGGGGPAAFVSNVFPTKLLIQRGFLESDFGSGSFAESGVAFRDAVDATKIDTFFRAKGISTPIKANGAAIEQISCVAFENTANAKSFALQFEGSVHNRAVLRINIDSAE